MAEYHTVSLGKTVSYTGYFDFAKLWRVIRDYMESRGFFYTERQHNEIVKEHGKEIYIEVDVDRELSDYVKGRVRIECRVHDLVDVEVDVDGKKKVLNDGKVTITFESYVLTDWEGRFDGMGYLFFIRTMLEKFVYERQINKFKHIVQEDQDALIKEIRAYLNLFNY